MNSLPLQVNEIDVMHYIAAQGQQSFVLDMQASFLQEIQSQAIVFRHGLIILLCRDVSATLHIDAKAYELSGTSLLMIPENHLLDHLQLQKAGQVASIAVSSDYVLNLPTPIDTNIFNYSRHLSLLKISEEKYNDLQTYYRFLHKETKEVSPYQNEILQSIFYALILEIMGEYEMMFSAKTQSSLIHEDPLSDKFFNLLNLHYKRQHSVQFYADAMNLTPKYLSTAIKRATGRPILDWIHEAVLIDAKILLRSSDMSVQQISEQLHFSSPSAFVQFFKHHTGSTPRAARGIK